MRTLLAALLLTSLAMPAYASGGRIQPTCREDLGPDGRMYRHCEVDRPPGPKVIPLPYNTAGPPPPPPPIVTPDRLPPPDYQVLPWLGPAYYSPPGGYIRVAPNYGYAVPPPPIYAYPPPGPVYYNPYFDGPPILLRFGPISFGFGGPHW